MTNIFYDSLEDLYWCCVDPVFLEEGRRSKEYEMFMQNVYSFSITGKNKHDDAPDSLASLCQRAKFRKASSGPTLF